MLRSYFSRDGTGSLVQIKETVDVSIYQEPLEDLTLVHASDKMPPSLCLQHNNKQLAPSKETTSKSRLAKSKSGFKSDTAPLERVRPTEPVRTSYNFHKDFILNALET